MKKEKGCGFRIYDDEVKKKEEYTREKRWYEKYTLPR